ncbi:MAG: tyrosine-type recombinase/integrase, partial [Devosia sp.]
EKGSDRPETFAAKRWIPWLLAYTGARVGEIAQLRKQDLHEAGDHWRITITPEAGTVKSNEARQVPLHPHLVEQGFIEFVKGAPDGHLFLKPNAKTGDVLGPMTGVKNRVREFVREHVPDPTVQPNHAWRHLFITRSRAAGVDQELRRMITGHTGSGVDERVYGDPAGLYREICKLPRFEYRT